MSTRASTYEAERGSGWLVFAGTMLALLYGLAVYGTTREY
jgi:hypothetical protein